MHHEPTIDERDEVRRHVTVLVLTPSRLILATPTSTPPDELLPAPYTSTSTGGRAPDSITNVVVSRMVANPANYAAGCRRRRRGGADHWLGWRRPRSTSSRPCATTRECDADHGYTGVVR